MVLQVIGAGFGRTGTHSLAVALEKLGFDPCYHMLEVGKNPHHVDIWNDAIDDKPVNWNTVFQSYKSAVEWPSVAFLSQLLETFPQAKVILTLRDAVSWYESAAATIFEGLELSQYNPNPKHPKQGAMNRRLILEQTFSGKYKDKDYAIGVYGQHNRTVREIVPSHRLLQFSIKEGWQPLCDFLEKPVPNEPFPRVNDRASFLSEMPEWARQAKASLSTNTKDEL